MMAEGSVVWFKRDLRVRDHAALARASELGSVIPLYIFEPVLLAAEDFDDLHLRFIRESLGELDERLGRLGARLLAVRGDAVEVLEALWDATRFGRIFSHEETGVAATYKRDLAVAAWARSRGVRWTELPQFGVVRGLRDRSGWARRWDRMMERPEAVVPDQIVMPHGIPERFTTRISGVMAKHAGARDATLVQSGGESAACELLHSFLAERGKNYSRAMSSPVDGATACSRLSPHFAWGSLSIRCAAQAAWSALRHESPSATIPKGCVRSFVGRLHWHCHFIQKLESEPEIELRCFHRAYESLRPREPDPARFSAWCGGRTGYPFVDACMRFLRAGGWLNFRMRAMLVSFAAYHLWMDWRAIRDFLARQFLDYEPGIHISQLQMQSGVTGINTLRIYNPIKQGRDFDPAGDFVRRWVPELRDVPGSWIHEPWLLGELDLGASGVRLGETYPRPVVDHREAVGLARSEIATIRRNPETRMESAKVFERHGSRKRGTAKERAVRIAGSDSDEFSGRTGRKSESDEQLGFDGI